MKKSEREFLEKLQEKGLMISVMNIDGYYAPFSIGIDDIDEYLKDDFKWFAKVNRVTEEILSQYLEYLRTSHRCTALTQKGEQCRNHAASYCQDADEFKPGITDRCSIHQKAPY